MKLVVACPAKVNLFLSVGPPDATGYHPLRTVFQAISLFDELMIEIADRTEILCDWAGLPPENTLTKTLRLLQEIAILPPLRIYLNKRIPPQSGLGGGSSNAGGLIRAARKLVPSITDLEAFMIARAVGADAPFFLLGGRAKGEGYGEKLTPMPVEGPDWFIVAQPEDAVCPTAETYRELDRVAYPWREFPETLTLSNDFERVAPAESINLIQAIRGIGALDSGLTGSGSAAFGRFESEASARAAEAELRSNLGLAKVWTVKTLDSQQSLAIKLEN